MTIQGHQKKMHSRTGDTSFGGWGCASIPADQQGEAQGRFVGQLRSSYDAVLPRRPDAFATPGRRAVPTARCVSSSRASGQRRADLGLILSGRRVTNSRGWCVSLDDLAAFRARIAAGMIPEQAAALDDRPMAVNQTDRIEPEPRKRVSDPLHFQRLSRVAGFDSRDRDTKGFRVVRMPFQGDGIVFRG